MWKVRINRKDGTNNIQITIPTIPDININIIIYQQMDALEYGNIYRKK